jgi:ribonuclease HI
MNTHFSALREQNEIKSVQQPTLAMPRNIVTSGINSSNAGTQRIQQQHADHSRQGTDDTTIDDQGIMDSHAGINQATLQENRQSITMTNRFLVPSPTLLQGYRCYTDASTQPDLAFSNPRDAGIGIFIVNTTMHPPHNIFIKAAMRNSSSVLMAEAGALALVAVLLKQIQLHHTTLLSDNQQLVHFLNGSDLSHPPDWRMKPYTQIISSTLPGTTTAIRKITRTQNQMADLLARQALRDLHSNPHSFSGVCTHSAHVQECPLLMAL